MHPAQARRWIMNNRCLSFVGLFLRQYSEAVLGQQWVHEASGWLVIYIKNKDIVLTDLSQGTQRICLC